VRVVFKSMGGGGAGCAQSPECLTLM
jgi:hypothetical protein